VGYDTFLEPIINIDEKIARTDGEKGIYVLGGSEINKSFRPERNNINN
jgi:hypothetical protein